MSAKIRGALLIFGGLLLTFAAAARFAEYDHRAQIAGENAGILLEGLKDEIRLPEPGVEEQVHLRPVLAEDTSLREGEAVRTEAIEEEPAHNEMPQMTMNGYALVGILQVPSVGLELPVLNQWDYSLLKIAPCRYSGSVAEGNLILLGHNYEQHFNPLKKLSVGDRVIFITVDGMRYEYAVAATEILKKTELERLTTSGYELTLFTCTTGGHNRFTVRCELI